MAIDLAHSLDDLRRNLEVALAELHKCAANLIATYQTDFDKLLAYYGKQRCPACDGTGKIERLDAGIMKKFSLREWNGCSRCGSTHPEVPGQGFISSEDE